MKSIQSRSLRILYFSAIVLLLSGCNLASQNGSMQTPQQLVAQQQAIMLQAVSHSKFITPQDPNGSYTVELRNAFGARTRVRLPLQQGLCVEDALRQSKALESFDHMLIKLKRPTKDPRRFLPLDIEFSAEYRRVDPIKNYALHNGDYIIVTQSAGADIGELMDGATAPILGL